MPTRAPDLAELRGKYEEILRLRLLQGSDGAPNPRGAMAALAARFPGALREMDAMALPEIRARVEALRLAESDAARILPWMRAIARFHALTRGALSAKRWLAGSTKPDRKAFARDLPTLPDVEDVRQWSTDLEKIARPPRGRITDLVFARIAAELGVTHEEARVLVFGPPRRKRVSSSKPVE